MGRYTGKTCRLNTMLALTATFFLVEIIVGYVTHSIALVADSFHMLSDVVALIVGLASVRISKWPSKRNTYGWVRAEVLGALVNSVFLVALCFSIVVESIKRFLEVEKIQNPTLLLIVGAAGLLVNVIGLIMFGGHSHGGHGHSHGGGGGGHGHGHSHGQGHGHNHAHNSSNNHIHSGDGLQQDQADKTVANGGINHENEMLMSPPISNIHLNSDSYDTSSVDPPTQQEVHVRSIESPVIIETEKPQIASSHHLNMRGVFLHVLGDAMGSVAVIISAVVIKTVDAEWKHYVDPSLSLIMVCIILTTAIPLLKESAFILLQTVPSHVNVEKIIKELEDMEGIYGVHECHIWQLAGNRIVASAHIRCHGIEEYMELAKTIKQLFHKAGIHSTTIQPEFVNWHETAPNQPCALMCQSGGQLCMSNTCCGHKHARAMQSLPGEGDVDRVNNLNNSAAGINKSIASLEGNAEADMSMLTSAHSMEIKISPEGDEIVLEMSDLSVLKEGEGGV